MFKPLIDALFDAVPVAWDMYSNFIYRLVTGRKFEDNIEVLEGDIMEVENIVKYEYIPTEEIKDISKEVRLKDIISIIRGVSYTTGEIETEEGMPITLSIAISNEGKTNYEKYESASVAMDIALGRGGDQAVIRQDGKYVFFVTPYTAVVISNPQNIPFI